MTKEKMIEQPSGLGYNGEFRIGKITLATLDGELVLRKENEGSETHINEAVLEGVLDEHFFTRKVDGDGKVQIGS